MNGMMRLAACALILGSSAVASAETLQVDGFTAGMAVGYQGGFAAGEAAAVELTPATSESWRVDKVRFLYGPGAVSNDITVGIYAASGSATPGAVLFEDNFTAMGSNDAMVEVDLTAQNIVVTSAFRVVITLQNAGDPSLARDSDGTIDTAKNFISIQDGGGGHLWLNSNLAGLTGDWVIRADVTKLGGGGGTPDAGPNDPDASTSNPADGGMSTGGADAGAGASCMLNSDCALGSYCGDDSTCAIDCRNDIDCTGDQSCEPALGKCEEKSSGGGGCSTSGGSGLGSLGAGLLLIGLFAIRRRSRQG